MKPITKRQQEVLDFIVAFIAQNNYSPTTREIANAVGLASGSTVYGMMKKLQSNGLISWKPNEPRTIKVIKQEEGKIRCFSVGESVPLDELKSGSLFIYGETIGLKSEYRNEHGAIEAYIVGSGELFWEGFTDISEQANLMVQPLVLEAEVKDICAL